uniref:Secreted protein n=1 Tax=Parascaris univalens TaxID=6257 RepID=A0A915BAY5_PARUN
MCAIKCEVLSFAVMVLLLKRKQQPSFLICEYLLNEMLANRTTFHLFCQGTNEHCFCSHAIIVF